MHSSRMRATLLFTVGVRRCNPWGKGVLSITGSDIMTPHPLNRMTDVKTLPSRNFVLRAVNIQNYKNQQIDVCQSCWDDYHNLAVKYWDFRPSAEEKGKFFQGSPLKSVKHDGGVGRVLLREVSLISGARTSSFCDGFGFRDSVGCRHSSQWKVMAIDSLNLPSFKVRFESLLFSFIHSLVCYAIFTGDDDWTVLNLLPVADSGFSREGANSWVWGKTYYLTRFLSQTTWKWNKLNRGVCN